MSIYLSIYVSIYLSIYLSTPIYLPITRHSSKVVFFIFYFCFFTVAHYCAVQYVQIKLIVGHIYVVTPVKATRERNERLVILSTTNII